MIEALQEALRESLERRRRHEDAACWAMLSDPLERGVLVTERGLDYSIELSQEVPWLEIHVRKEAGS